MRKIEAPRHTISFRIEEVLYELLKAAKRRIFETEGKKVPINVLITEAVREKYRGDE